MKDFEFPRTNASGYRMNGLIFSRYIEIAVPDVKFVVRCNGDECHIIFERDLEDDEMTDLTVAVDGFADLAPPQGRMFEAIDQRTQNITADGFEYPASSGQFFSLSEKAQRDLGALKALLLNNSLSYPLIYNTIDNFGELVIANKPDAEAFCAAGMDAIRAADDSGTVLKSAVRDATTPAELAAVVDTR